MFDVAPWKLTGLISAAAWIAALIAFSLLGFNAIGFWAGPLVFLIVGRLYGLRDSGHWVRAGLLTVGIVGFVWVVAAVAAFAVFIATALPVS